jgi:hypothetical protein
VTIDYVSYIAIAITERAGVRLQKQKIEGFLKRDSNQFWNTFDRRLIGDNLERIQKEEEPASAQGSRG